MDSDLSQAVTQLARGAVLRIADGQGSGVAVFRGTLWVTQQGDPQDALVQGGDTFAITRGGATLMQAMEDTSLIVFELQPEAELAVL